MKTFILISALMGAMLLVPPATTAEDYAIREPGSGGVTFQSHSSTFAEGAMRGLGDASRGLGDLLYDSSLAAINREHARRLFMENREQYVKSYFEMRRVNREARAYERGPAPTREELERYSQVRLPDRLSRYEYEPALGTLYWPPVLQDARFAAERQVLDELMADRAFADHRPGTDMYRQIQQLTNQLHQKLRMEIGALSPAEYVQAKRFLDSLAYEAQLPPPNAAEVANQRSATSTVAR